MSEGRVVPPVAGRKAPRVQTLEIAGRAYVLVRKADYERLRLHAEESQEDSSPFRTRSIGPDLRQRRQKACLTLSEVAAKAGIRLETLSRIENARTNPTVGTVQAILRALERDF
jgi:DNA-binding XRE family transcriptional regulator